MSELRQATVGKWRGILSSLGIDEAYLTRKNGPCPMCGGRDRWRWTDYRGEGRWICNQCGKGDGFDLLMRVNGWAFRDAADAIEKIIGTVKDEPRRKADPSVRITSIRARAVQSHPCVTAYLASRGLRQAPGLRAHPSVDYFDDGKRVGTYPAMIGCVQAPNGDLRSLHITYLEDGKKAPVASPRKMLTPSGSLDGCAIRLYQRAEHMGVAEGIETAIAAHALFRLPVWSVINTTLMEKWQAPEGVRRVTIFADHDGNYAGHKAAYALAFKLANEGLSVDVRVPPELGDWNDRLRDARTAV